VLVIGSSIQSPVLVIQTRDSCYLGGGGDGVDDTRDEGSDLRQVLPEQGEAVIVDPELSHDKERPAEEGPALRGAAQRRLERLEPPQLHGGAGVESQAPDDGDVPVEAGVAGEGARHGEVGASPEAAAARQGRRHEREVQLLRCGAHMAAWHGERMRTHHGTLASGLEMMSPASALAYR